MLNCGFSSFGKFLRKAADPEKRALLYLRTVLITQERVSNSVRTMTLPVVGPWWVCGMHRMDTGKSRPWTPIAHCVASTNVGYDLTCHDHGNLGLPPSHRPAFSEPQLILNTWPPGVSGMSVVLPLDWPTSIHIHSKIKMLDEKKSHTNISHVCKNKNHQINLSCDMNPNRLQFANCVRRGCHDGSLAVDLSCATGVRS